MCQVLLFLCALRARSARARLRARLRLRARHSLALRHSLARSVQAWPFACLAPASGSQCPSLAFFASGSSIWLAAPKLGFFRVWLQHLARGVEAWPFTRLAPASGSLRRSLAFFVFGPSLCNILPFNLRNIWFNQLGRGQVFRSRNIVFVCASFVRP